MLELNIEYGPIGYTQPLAITQYWETMHASINDAIDKVTNRLLTDLALINDHIDYASSDPRPTKVYLQWEGEMACGTTSVECWDSFALQFLTHEALGVIAQNMVREYHWRWQEGFNVLGHNFDLTCGSVVARTKEQAMTEALNQQARTAQARNLPYTKAPTLTIEEI